MKDDQQGAKLYVWPITRFQPLALFAGLIVCVAIITATVFACGWSGTDHSVRFNTYRMANEFGRLPPISKQQTRKVNRLFSWDEEMNVYFDPDRDYKSHYEVVKELWADADRAIQDGKLTLARKRLLDYLDETTFDRNAWSEGAKELQGRRNSAVDKIDALTALEEGSPASAVQAYLNARSLYDLESASSGLTESLVIARKDKNLKDNVAYLESALLYRGDGEKGVEAFAKVAANYPRSEKREAALFMCALATMKQGRSFGANKDDEAPSESCNDCRDAYWHKARAGFERVLREYPQGRYRADAQGWLAYLWLDVGDRANALADYYRMLASKNEAARIEAVYSLGLVRDKASDEEMRQVEELIQSETETALAYAYHNIYNYASIRLYDRYLWDSFYQTGSRSERDEVERIVAFANRMLRRYPQSPTGPAFAVRLAEANLELENFGEAAKLARRALTLGVQGEHRAEALWVAGYSEYRLKKYQTAREALSILIKENPANRYTEGARRNLAMLEEEAGNLEGALEQYLALDYRHDVAYFVDVLMKPEELKQFVDRHPDIKQREELLYALGIRYLRDFRWQDARQTLLNLHTTGRSVDWKIQRSYSQNDDEVADEKTPIKMRQFDFRIRAIRPQWVERDLLTANDLERLEHQYCSAPDDEAKADALYQFASYIYQGNLLFYNPLEWELSRADLLADLHGSDLLRQPGESQLLFDYMQKHDMASRALEIYLDVVKKYPNTRAARDALYTAAVCHERLREYNNYWREIYAEEGHAGERMVTYRDVKRAYPDYRFPLGTIGWEPATRTVNGGPGWAALPKPKPKPTFKERAFRYAKVMMKKMAKKTRKTVGFWVNLHLNALALVLKFTLGFFKCLWFGCAFVFSCLLCGWAAEARRLLQLELAECQSRPRNEGEEKETASAAILLSTSLSSKDEAGQLLSPFDKYLNKELRDEWETYAKDVCYKIKQLARCKRGKSLLALNAVTHWILVVLLFQLLNAFK